MNQRGAGVSLRAGRIVDDDTGVHIRSVESEIALRHQGMKRNQGVK
jgi:hypothetical protein